MNNFFITFKDIIHVCGAKVYFSYRPPEGGTRPADPKDVEKSAEKPTESSGEVEV